MSPQINSTVPDSFTVTWAHSVSFSWKNLTAALMYQHMLYQNNYSFPHIILLCVSVFPMFRGCHLLIWKKNNQTGKKIQTTQTSQHQPTFAVWSLSFLCTQQPPLTPPSFFFPSIHSRKETTFSKNGKENRANKFTGLYRVDFLLKYAVAS